MKSLVKKYFCALLVMAIGLSGAAAVTVQRAQVEGQNRQAVAVMGYEQAEELSAGKGLGAVKKAGIAALVLEDSAGKWDKNAIDATINAGLGLILSPTSDQGLKNYAEYAKQYTLYPLYLSQIADTGLLRDNMAVGLVERDNQLGSEAIKGFQPEQSGVPMVRVFKLTDKFRQRYGVLGYTGGQEIENMFYRAVTERGIRVLWLDLFIDSRTKEPVRDLNEYQKVLSGLASRLDNHGITLNDTFSTLPRVHVDAVLLGLVWWGSLGAGMLLLMLYISIKKWVQYLIAASGFVLCMVGAFLKLELLRPLGALFIAIVFACLAVETLIRFCGIKPSSRFDLAGLVCAVIFSLMGGLFVGACLYSTDYMLELSYFRGVKISQLTPVLYAGFAVWYHCWRNNGKEKLFSVDRKKAVWLTALAVVIGIIGIFIFIARTGDGILSVSTLEQRLRNLLEYVLPVRPRTKEFLLAFPAAVIAPWLWHLDRKKLSGLLCLVSSVGFASVIDTFCHVRAPILLSILRSGESFLAGAVLGFALVYILNLLIRKKQRKTM